MGPHAQLLGAGALGMAAAAGGGGVGGSGGLDPVLKTRFEQVGIEYRGVRRFRNPVADALARVVREQLPASGTQTPKSSRGSQLKLNRSTVSFAGLARSGDSGKQTREQGKDRGQTSFPSSTPAASSADLRTDPRRSRVSFDVPSSMARDRERERQRQSSSNISNTPSNNLNEDDDDPEGRQSYGSGSAGTRTPGTPGTLVGMMTPNMQRMGERDEVLGICRRLWELGDVGEVGEEA